MPKRKKIDPRKITEQQAATILLQQEQRQTEQRREKRKQKREAEVFRKAVAKLRVRQSERESFVFISTDGKRLSTSSNRKGFLLYVSGSGKKRPVVSGSGTSKPKKFSSFSPERTNRKRALRKLYASHRLVSGPFTFLSKRGKGVDLSTVAQHLSRELKKSSRSRADETLLVEGLVRVEGLRRLIDFQFTFHRRYFSKRINYGSFARAKLFHHIGTELDLRDIVSKQSSAYIRELKYEGKKVNRGKNKSALQAPRRGKNGKIIGLESWARKNNREKAIRSVEYKISRIIVTSSE